MFTDRQAPGITISIRDPNVYSSPSPSKRPTTMQASASLPLSKRLASSLLPNNPRRPTARDTPASVTCFGTSFSFKTSSSPLLLLDPLPTILRLQQSNLRPPKSVLQSPRESPPGILSTKGKRQCHTMLNNLQAGSLGCAPTPNQYFALEVSSLISLIALPSPEGEGLGTGS